MNKGPALQRSFETEISQDSSKGRLNPRYFVPDLSVQDREELKNMKPHFIFVAESPHVSEIESDVKNERRPLCGAAGKQWWGLLSEILDGEANSDVSLERLLSFCKKYRIFVMNAVQFPLDPKVAAKFPQADPTKNLGFNKVSGPYSYKKLKNTPLVKEAIQRLRMRLTDPRLDNIPVYCLGNDSEWFVNQALTDEEKLNRYRGKIPHPSAWWRRGGYYGQVAKEKLNSILSL